MNVRKPKPTDTDMPTYPDPDSRNALAPDCERCPALVECRERISWGNGPRDATVFVVGEAPGAGNPDAERWRGGNWTGMAYTSRHSGRRIRELLASVGYGGECYFTNAVKCFPADGEGSNREPTPEERANCRPYLRREIEQVDPSAVLPTGKHATLSILSLEGSITYERNKSYQGKIPRERNVLDGFLEHVLDPIDCPGLGVTVVPLVHPSYQVIGTDYKK